MPLHACELIVITLLAAVVNGALGYGFSSITVPLALLLFTNRVLNPALVVTEVGLNAYMLWINREALPSVRQRVWPIVAGLAPGVIAGTFIVALVRPDWLKVATFVLLLPVILVQAAGYRRPIRAERAFGVPFGAGVGVLYSVTTISGPVLSALLNNQGLAQQEFRAALAFIRLAESSLTALAYLFAGLYTRDSLALAPAILPSLLVGVPLGAWLIRRLNPETFRRCCMSFDAWVVAFGLSTMLRSLRIVEGPEAYGVLVAVAAIDAVLLSWFFSHGRPEAIIASGSPAR